jgi:hypothetical protein
MRTGRVEANLTYLLDDAPRIPYLADLIAEKQAEGEHASARPDDRYSEDIDRLRAALEHERDRSTLVAAPTVRGALHDFVVRTRLSADLQVG